MVEAIVWIAAIFLFLMCFASIVRGSGDPAAKAEPEKGKGEKYKPLIIPKTGLKIPAQIVYSGGSKPGGRRDILINSIQDGFDVETQISTKMISAFCKTARETRTFRVDRITELIDLKTGEVVSDAGKWITTAIAEGKRARRAEKAALAQRRPQ